MVDPASFAGKERKVRCIACGHEWIESLNPEKNSEQPKAKKSLYKKMLAWPLFAFTSICLVVSLVAFKDPIQNYLPGLSSAYSILGMNTPHSSALKIDNVHCATLNENQHTYVVVKGTVKANADTDMPEFFVKLYDDEAELDESGKCLKNCHPIKWSFKLKETHMKKGEAISFEEKSPQPVLEDISGCHISFR